MGLEEQILGLLQEISAKQAEMEARLEGVLGAFPSSDLDGHRRYHEAVIEWQELRNKMLREALIKAGSAGLLAGLGWLLWAAWQLLKLEVKS